METIISLEEHIIEALKNIFDPEIPVNIYDLGLIYGIIVDEDNGSVKIEMTLTSPACPVAQTFPQTVQDHVLMVSGVSSVSVELVWDPPWDKEKMSEVAKLQLNLF
jgi:FeS assembly SUF system protein